MRFHVQSKREWITSQNDFVLHRSTQHNGQKFGWALKGHMDSAHAGEFDQNCPACLEIKKKMESL